MLKEFGIPYGRQNINAADIQAVVEVLQSDFITQGPAIERFEQAVANYCGTRYAVAVSNATAGLHIACMAAGLGPGDRLWTVPNTFVASANCGLYCGAQIDFVDIDPQTYTMSIPALRLKLEQAYKLDQKREKSQKTRHLPKVVIPVHFAGQSCDMVAIAELARQYGFTVIEDAAHAIGGRYLDQPIGSCQYSAMAVFSFHPVKIITTGEGGMVMTNREDLYQQLLRFRSHGITRDANNHETPQESWAYYQISLGYNYRMTDIQAALGASQMNRLGDFVKRRHELAQRYDQHLKGLPLICPVQAPENYSAYHLYPIRLKLNEIQQSRRAVFDALREAGIGVNVHYIPVHTQPYYQNLGFHPGDFPEAESYYQEALSLPLYYDLSEAHQDFVIQTLREILK